MLFYADVKRKLNALLERDAGTLTYQQASDLADLYFYMAQRNFRSTVEEFMRSDFEACLQRGDQESIKKLLYGKLRDQLRTTRDKMATFRIVGGCSFKQFIDEVAPQDSGIVTECFDRYDAVIRNMSADNVDVEKACSTVVNIIAEHGAQASVAVHQELGRRYDGRR